MPRRSLDRFRLRLAWLRFKEFLAWSGDRSATSPTAAPAACAKCERRGFATGRAFAGAVYSSGQVVITIASVDRAIYDDGRCDATQQQLLKAARPAAI